jgi:long-subunit acyl-CoA synthetase (AMP-forming)
VYQNVSIEHPDLQPDGGLDSIFTILHTGGSGGRPKQVIVKARGFARDIGAKNYMMPLITCSYIPLSHSSDRFKLWEVCCCGGSVAFAFYEASHWLSHERLKKSQALETGSLESVDFSSVDSLLRQLQDVQITAMSCPPNILAGVYRMYNQWTSRGGMSHQEACHRVRQLFGGRLKTIATGGAPTPSEIMSAVREWFPKASFVDSFGTTECGAISANGKLLTEKGVRVKVRRLDNEPCCGVVSGELLVFSPSMSAGYLNDETRTAESFIQLPCDGVSIFPAVGEEDTAVTWYATGDLVEISYDEHAFRNHVQGQAWAKHISVKGRICSQVKLSSGSMVSPDVLESIYNSSLFSDIYIDARTTSSAIVAIVTPAASLKDLKQPDGSPLFDFDEICPRDFFSPVEGHRNEVGSQFYTRRRQVLLSL